MEHIINEPTTSTIAYGIEKTRGKPNVLVFNLSGGTFDVTLIVINNGLFEIHTTNGDTYQGGKNFEQRVMHYFIKIMKKRSTTGNSWNNAIRVKYVLSSQQYALLGIKDRVKVFHFLEILTCTLRGTEQPSVQKDVQKVIKDTDVSKLVVEDIIPVGGFTRIPKVGGYGQC